MHRDEFMRQLHAEGFEQFVTVEREPNGTLDEHTHPFEAKALVIAGEILIESAGVKRTVRAGETFHLAAGQPHSERYGPDGVSYLVGRK